MSIVFDIIKLSSREDKNIDYKTLIFVANIPKKLELENSSDFWHFFRTIINGGALKIVANMKNTEFIDSSGIATLVNTAKLIRKMDGEFVLASVNSSVKNIFRMVNLQHFIKIFNNEGEALNFFRYI